MPTDRDQPKRDAEDAHAFFNRLVAKGHSRAEAIQLTGAWILARLAKAEQDERPEWERDT